MSSWVLSRCLLALFRPYAWVALNMPEEVVGLPAYQCSCGMYNNCIPICCRATRFRSRHSAERSRGASFPQLAQGND